MKQILLVAHDYPPSTLVGAIRPSKFARYLPDLGWQAIVLTVALQDFVGRGSEKNDEGKVYRVSEWPHPIKTWERFRERRAMQKGCFKELQVRWSVSRDALISPPHDVIVHIKRWIFSFFRLPDEETGWLLPAIWKSLRLIREKKINCIITTAPPFTCHLVGLALKRLTKVPWIADFRDPWTVNRRPLLFRNRIGDAIEAKLIRSVMAEADRVICVTTQWTEETQKEHPGLEPGKFLTVTNGFDPYDFSGLVQTRPSPAPVIFSYIGTFYPGQSPEPFLRALKALIDDGNVKRNEVKVRFVGQVAIADGQLVSVMVKNLGLEDIVILVAPIPRKEALRLNLETHVALVITDHYPQPLGAGQVSLKVYEALAAGSIILNIGMARGAVADLLEKTGRGISVRHTDLTEIQASILECIRRSQAARVQRTQEPWWDPAIQEFNYQQLTNRLVQLLAGLEDTA